MCCCFHLFLKRDIASHRVVGWEHLRSGSFVLQFTDIKSGLLSNTCFKESSNMGFLPKLWVKINLYKKYLPVIKWNKKHSLNEVVSMIVHTSDFLAATIYGFVRRFFSGRVKKFILYFNLYEPSLHLLRKEDQIDTVYGTKFSLPHVHI